MSQNQKIPKRFYLIDKVLPSGTVHLLAGPSGAGKTTLIFEMARAWQENEPFLGFQTKGSDEGSFYYVFGDHSEDEALEHMTRLGLQGTIKYRAEGRADAAPQDFYQCPKDTRILVIDGAERLVEAANLNSFDAVSKALIRTREFAESRNIAVILIVGSPKMKKGEEYLYGRERVCGSIAWGRFSSTVMNCTMGDPSVVDDPSRTLFIYPRHHKPSQHSLTIGSNGFTKAIPPDVSLCRTLIMSSMPVGQLFERRQLSLLAQQSGLNEKVLDQALKGLMSEGLVLQDPNGKYSQKNLLNG